MSDLDTILLAAKALGIIIGSWLIGELLTKAIVRVARRAGASSSVLRAVRPTLSVLWIVFATAGVLTLTGVASVFSVLTLSGLAGLAVSLAMQNTLSNIISGLLLFFDGALRLDDSIAYGAVKGKVVKIAFRNTWIRMEDGNIAMISNSNLAAGPLINETAKERLEKRHQF